MTYHPGPAAQAGLLLSAFVAAGITWSVCRSGLTIRPQAGPIPDRSSALVTNYDPPAAVPVNIPLLALDVPLNSWVRAGQVIGRAAAAAEGARMADWDASVRFAETDRAVAAARDELDAVDSAIAIQRASQARDEQRLAAGETAAVEAEHALSSGEWRYREGIESELKHDAEIEQRRVALQQLDRQRAQAELAGMEVDDLMARRWEAQVNLREALELRRNAEAAALDLGGVPRFVPVVSPADGYLVLRDGASGLYSIAARR